jgi:hypothetical protein
LQNVIAFRTPFLHPALAHNELIIKEKGLLFAEQPYQNLGEITGCSEKGISFEHYMSILAIIQ